MVEPVFRMIFFSPSRLSSALFLTWNFNLTLLLCAWTCYCKDLLRALLRRKGRQGLFECATYAKATPMPEHAHTHQSSIKRERLRSKEGKDYSSAQLTRRQRQCQCTPAHTKAVSNASDFEVRKGRTTRKCNLREGNANASARPHTPKQYQTRATSK